MGAEAVVDIGVKGTVEANGVRVGKGEGVERGCYLLGELARLIVLDKEDRLTRRMREG